MVVTTDQPTPPTPGPTPSPVPTITPGEGGPIVYSYFADNMSGTKSDLFVLDPDTNQTQNITNSPQLAEVQPSWAPDRARVAYAASVVNTAADPWSIWVRDVTTGQAASITTGPEQYEPDWHPSGALIAFTSIGRSGGTPISSEIAVVAPNGSGYRSILRVNSSSMGVVNPNWSPDGTRLAFSLSSSLLGGELYQVNADGSNAVPLYSHPGWDDIDPEWSPDGRYVAFSSGPNQGTVTRHDIWLLDTVTGIAGAVALAPTWDLRRPAWSPDGTRLVFTARFQTQPAAWALYIVPATGGTVTGPLTLGVEPDWAAGSLVPVPTPTPGATSGTPPPFPTLPSPEPTLPGPTATPPIIPTFPPPETPEPTPTPSTPGADAHAAVAHPAVAHGDNGHAGADRVSTVPAVDIPGHRHPLARIQPRTATTGVSQPAGANRKRAGPPRSRPSLLGADIASSFLRPAAGSSLARHEVLVRVVVVVGPARQRDASGSPTTSATNAAISASTARRAWWWGTWPQPGISRTVTGPPTPAAMASNCARVP